MKLRYNMQFQKVGTTFIGVAVGEDKHLFKGMLSLNETGFFIAQLLKEEHSRQDLVTCLLEEYDAEEAELSLYVDEVLLYLQKSGVL